MVLIILVFLIMENISAVADRRDEARLYPSRRLADSPLKKTIIGLSLADAAAIGFLVYICCALDFHWYTRACYILLGLLAEGLLVGLLTQWLTTKRFWVWCGCVVIAACALWGSQRYNRYLRDITLPEYFDYRTFMPFTEASLVKRADEPAALRFDQVDSVPRMDGATALYPVYAAFAQATYPNAMAKMSNAEIDEIVHCSTTSGAYQNIVDGKCDIIFVAGPSEKQEAYAAEKGVQLIFTPIGREAFVFFVPPDNPIDGLTVPQLRSIYSGETTRWDQLGVNGLGNILAYQRSEGSGSQTALQRFVMKNTPLMAPEKETRMDGMGDIVEAVSSYRNHKNALGFSFRFYCTALMKNFSVKLLAVDGAAPTEENIKNGTYPLASSFYAVTRGDADENTLALLEWIRGPQGQALIEKTGYTPMGSREHQT